MATPDFNVCDICGQWVPKENRLRVPVGREAAGAGNQVTDVKHVDLCERHQSVALMHLVHPGSPDYEAGRRLVKWVKEQKKAEAA